MGVARKDITAARVERTERKDITAARVEKEERRVERKATILHITANASTTTMMTIIMVERRAENAERLAKREERKVTTERAAKEERKDIMKSLAKEEIGIPDAMVCFARPIFFQSLAALPMRYSLTSV